MKVLNKNKHAFFEYEILETYQAGVVLTGDEIKSIRKHNASLKESFALAREGEVMIQNWYIPAYSHAYSKSEEKTRRTRKLLLHKREIDKIIGAVSRKGLTLIPLTLLMSGKGLVKIDLGLAKHKKLVDKKKAIKDRDLARENQRELRERSR